ncbi:hypothetical protein ACJ2A9_09095 [Anaerobacillus sp. MEB173]|uniref:hypothetical protein n=1 Tax=Anaerobacillus sp. MEB173 TaxID=3383345 RepID=UPI003F91B550
MKIAFFSEQLSDQTKMKIIDAQNTFAFNQEKDLCRRIQCSEYIGRLYDSLTENEQTVLRVFLFFSRDGMLSNEKFLQAIRTLRSSEYKVALVALRQKGFLFVGRKEKEEVYYLPEEYLIYLIQRETMKIPYYVHTTTKESTSINRLLYYLFLLLHEIQQKKDFLSKNGEIGSQHRRMLITKYSSNSDEEGMLKRVIHLLIQFLQNESVVVPKQNRWLIDEIRLGRFLQNGLTEIENHLISYTIHQIVDKPYYSLIIAHLVLQAKESKCLNPSFISKWLYQQNEEVLRDRIEEIMEIFLYLDLVEKLMVEGHVVYRRKVNGTTAKLKGYSQGEIDVYLPSMIAPIQLWEFSKWAKMVSWDIVVHFQFAKENIKSALSKKYEMSQLTNYIIQLFDERTAGKLTHHLEEWVKKYEPLKKKNQLSFYPITEKRLKMFVEQNWKDWILIVKEGILVEMENEQKLETLLNKEEVAIEQQVDKEVDKDTSKVSKKVIKLDDRYPDLMEAFPGLEQLPRQWLHLTKYDERTTVLLIKQAILLEMPIIYEETNNNTQIIIEPKQVTVNAGEYEIIDFENKKLRLSAINRIAIANPFQVEEKIGR